MSDPIHPNRFKLPEGALVGLKAAIIGFLVLILCIPVNLVSGVLQDRQSTRFMAVSEISEKAGGIAILGAAYIVIPLSYEVASRDDNGKIIKSWEKMEKVVMPTELSIKVDTKAELRTRGIFQVPVYQANATLEMGFDFNVEEANLEKAIALWDEARLVLEVADARSLSEAPLLNDKITMRAATPVFRYLTRAVSAPIRMVASPSDRGEGSCAASIRLKLSGAESIRFLSSGETTRVSLSGDWESPSFSGYRLPNSRTLSESGFTSSWYSDDSSRPFPRVLSPNSASEYSIGESLFGMEFKIPTDSYLQTYRALQYAILFILIPFLALFLFEVLLKRKLHPLQYLFIGLASCLFYLLLLSLSEHMAFMLAYLVAASAVTILVAIYAVAALGGIKRAMVIVGALVAQYAYLYCALDSEDFALLIGSIGLFVLVGGTMIGTRKIDWYKPRGRTEGKDSAQMKGLSE